MNLDSITKGYYEVWVNGAKVSQHTSNYKALMRSIEEKVKNNSADIHVKQPNIEPVVEGLDENLIFLTQVGYDNITPEENKIYSIKLWVTN